MGKVGTGFSRSLDGFIAEPSGDVGPLFDWHFGGDTDYTMPSGDMTLRVSPQSAELLRESHNRTGALVVGRRHFDHACAWDGRHPMDVPVFVGTHAVPQEWAHEGSPFTFVAEGVESAVERGRAAAGGGDVAQQCLQAGLVDEVAWTWCPFCSGRASGSSSAWGPTGSGWNARGWWRPPG